MAVQIGRAELPFADRQEAGRALAEMLAGLQLPPDSLVLAVPRGGIPLAVEIGRRLDLEVDVIVAHKIGAPGNPELAVGAVAADGTTIVEPWASDMHLPDDYLRRAAESQIDDARRREQRLRGSRPPPPIAGRTVIVVDDGIATGASVHAALLVVQRAGAARLIAATPVIGPDAAQRLSTIADDVVALAAPEWLGAIGFAYVRFDPVEDDEAAALLEAATRRPPGQTSR
jgi:putative phosphoribosyl transferase